MEANHENLQDPEGDLKFENELLKLKLEVEHSMKHEETSSSLSPEIENRWLNQIYNFEQQYKDAKRIKVFDALNRPAVKKLDELLPEEIASALEQLFFLMEKRGIALDCCCKYDEAIIYRFITEELFNCEVDDISIEGMVCHFIYEEFYPNHEYDLRRYVVDFFESLLLRTWEPKFKMYTLSETVSYKGKAYSQEDMSDMIVAFQQERTFRLEKSEIVEVVFDVDKASAKVQSRLIYQASSNQATQFYSGDAEIGFTLDFGYWYISRVQLPGFGDSPAFEKLTRSGTCLSRNVIFRMRALNKRLSFPIGEAAPCPFKWTE